MPRRTDRGEIPPTAGLPLHAGDLFPGRAALAEALAPLTGHADAILTCSGTAALVAALTALAAESPRRNVVIPAYTCPLVPIAVAHCGLEVRLCDVRPGRFEMDPAMLAAVVDKQTLAVVPAHLGGRLADIGVVNAIAHAAGAAVIEDAAQALGARHADGTPAGSAGDIGLFSLAAGKGLSIYEGGLLVGRDPVRRPALAAAAAKMLPSRPAWELRRSVELLGYAAFYRPRGLNLAYGRPLRAALRRGDPVGAVGDRFPMSIPLHRVGHWREAVGTRAAARLPAFLHTLNDQGRRRIGQLRAIPGVDVLDDAPGAHGTWPYFLLTLHDRTARDAALDRLWQAGLGVSRLFIHALPDYDYLADVVPPIEVPHARDFAARSLTISNSPWLDDERFADIVATLAAT